MERSTYYIIRRPNGNKLPGEWETEIEWLLSYYKKKNYTTCRLFSVINGTETPVLDYNFLYKWSGDLDQCSYENRNKFDRIMKHDLFPLEGAIAMAKSSLGSIQTKALNWKTPIDKLVLDELLKTSNNAIAQQLLSKSLIPMKNAIANGNINSGAICREFNPPLKWIKENRREIHLPALIRKGISMETLEYVYEELKESPLESGLIILLRMENFSSELKKEIIIKRIENLNVIHTWINIFYCIQEGIISFKELWGLLNNDNRDRLLLGMTKYYPPSPFVKEMTNFIESNFDIAKEWIYIDNEGYQVGGHGIHLERIE